VIVLDTNVLSALMLPRPERIVVDWLNRQPGELIWITAVTVLEARTGVDLLPEGRRKQQLEASFRRLLAEALRGRVLPLDRAAAEVAGTLAARRRREGRNIDIRDTQIAGIVLARGARLATRNRRDFDDASIELIDPWTA
jgi:toxin FitB